jgi:hypothetical protein
MNKKRTNLDHPSHHMHPAKKKELKKIRISFDALQIISLVYSFVSLFFFSLNNSFIKRKYIQMDLCCIDSALFFE